MRFGHKGLSSTLLKTGKHATGMCSSLKFKTEHILSVRKKQQETHKEEGGGGGEEKQAAAVCPENEVISYPEMKSFPVLGAPKHK